MTQNNLRHDVTLEQGFFFIAERLGPWTCTRSNPPDIVSQTRDIPNDVTAT